MALDEPNENDLQTINEVDILIGANVLPHTDGNQLDYFADERGEGFSLGPVNAKEDDCGCGC